MTWRWWGSRTRGKELEEEVQEDDDYDESQRFSLHSTPRRRKRRRRKKMCNSLKTEGSRERVEECRLLLIVSRT